MRSDGAASIGPWAAYLSPLTGIDNGWIHSLKSIQRVLKGSPDHRFQWNFIFADFEDPFLALRDAAARGNPDSEHLIRFFGEFGELSTPEERSEMLQAYWRSKYPEGLDHVGGSAALDFWTHYKTCMSGIHNSPTNSAYYESPTEVSFTTLEGAPARIALSKNHAHGTMGEIFRSDDGRHLLKRMYCRGDRCDDTLESTCREKAILAALNGLGSRVPRILSSLSDERLDKISILMESVGDCEMRSLQTSLSSSELFRSVARVLEIVMHMHAVGIVHRDIHFGNLMFSDPDRVVETMKLIDFGFAIPTVDQNNRPGFMRHLDELNPRQIDLQKIANGIERLVVDAPVFVSSTVDAFRAATSHMGLFDKFDYQKWISEFRTLADFLKSS
jgi:tRNA A-37 threonylcarbamoyl transferase component Bud32